MNERGYRLIRDGLINGNTRRYIGTQVHLRQVSNPQVLVLNTHAPLALPTSEDPLLLTSCPTSPSSTYFQDTYCTIIKNEF